MFLNFQVISEVYKELYKDAKKKFEESGKLPPYAVIFTSKVHEPGRTSLDLGEFSLPVDIQSSSFGSSLEVPINDQDDEFKERSFEAVQVLSELVRADCVLIVGEIWLKTLDLENPTLDLKVEEAIQFSFQSKDGAYHAQIPILRKGKKVRLPSTPPPLEPSEVLMGRSKVF